MPSFLLVETALSCCTRIVDSPWSEQRFMHTCILRSWTGDNLPD
jgi:hypothetical protein